MGMKKISLVKTPTSPFYTEKQQLLRNNSDLLIFLKRNVVYEKCLCQHESWVFIPLKKQGQKHR